jgi:hypothetical protein
LSPLRFKTVVVMAVAGTQPGADRGGQGLGVKPAERAADGGLGRDHEAAGERIATGAERGTNWLGRVGGPFGDRGKRPGTRQHRGRRQGQDGDQRVAAARARPGIGDGSQVGEQVRWFGMSQRAAITQRSQPRRDWDRG